MKRWQYLMSMFILILSVVVLIPTTVYAWSVYVERKAVTTIEAGDIDVSIQANQAPWIGDLSLDDLAFIDYQDDFVLDLTQTFDDMATSFVFNLTVSSDSLPLRNRLSLFNLSEDLLMFIIFEGVNAQTIQTNYRDLMLDIIDLNASYEDQRLAIQAYNMQVLEDIFDLVLQSNEYITIQFVFWGDYQIAQTIDQSYSIELLIETIQARGDFND